MRLIVNLIYVYPDGTRITRDNINAAILCLDADALNKAGLEDSLKCWNWREAANCLVECEKTRYLQQAFEQTIGDYISKEHLAGYEEAIQKDGSDKPLKERIQHYLQTRIDAICADPDAFFARIRQEIEKEREGNKGLSYYEVPPDARRAKAHRALLEQAVARLPDHLKTLLAHEEILLICSRMRGLLKGWSSYDSKAVIINRMEVEYCSDPNKLVPLLKEELLHFYDNALGFSERNEFRRVADALKENFAQIQAQLDIAHGGMGKTPVLQYKKDDYYKELLVEYFHLRDYLCKSQPQHDESYAARLFPGGGSDPVDLRMIQVFGPEFCSECRAFEEKLIAKAAEISPKQPAMPLPRY